MLLAGGLVGMGVLGPEVTLLYLPLAAGIGACSPLAGAGTAWHPFHGPCGADDPGREPAQASRLLDRYGFWAMFVSRFIPFVRVLPPC